MKIAVIGSRGMDSDYGGIERMLREICPRLVRRGHEVHVYSERRGRGRRMVDGVHVLGVPALPGKYTETLTRAALSTLLSLTRQYDVVQFCAEGPGMFAALARLASRRCVVSIHSIDWARDKWPLPAKLALRAAEGIALRSAHRIVVASRSLQHYMRLVHGRETVYIPNGTVIPALPPDPAPLARLGVTPGNFVLFAGRLVPEKGCHHLIAAFNALPQDRLKLVIAGHGRYEAAYVEKLKEMADPTKVIFAGQPDRPLRDALFGHCYLFVLPSTTDGPSPAVLEAVGHGRAVLVSDIPAHIEVVGGNAFTCTPDDPMDLRRQLSWLMDAEEPVRAMERRSVAVAQRFEWEAIVDEYERVFSAAAASGRVDLLRQREETRP
ncbi:glycosyltransferase family 4 protein [Telmatospirillum sp. J64-1]|uniref:glycosyltransferase family 4 protein n=1 Tax=Telmatospirillum sp. J64-1 TaxID=2502183 RepID=UPI00115E991B|nr:glycosyltransferase family 4 protein [Telmatospirillum sp. J64-1]